MSSDQTRQDGRPPSKQNFARRGGGVSQNQARPAASSGAAQTTGEPSEKAPLFTSVSRQQQARPPRPAGDGQQDQRSQDVRFDQSGRTGGPPQPRPPMQQQRAPVQQQQQANMARSQHPRPPMSQPHQQQQRQPQQNVARPQQSRPPMQQQRGQQQQHRSQGSDAMDIVAPVVDGQEAKKKKRNRKPKRLKQTPPGPGEEEAATEEPDEEEEEDETTSERPVAAKPTSSTTLAHLSKSTFESLDVSPVLKRAISEHLKFARMTVVQEATFPVIATGKDVLAKAKTGTGKTVGFLLHCLNSLVSRRSRPDSTAISVLILSPTRELACQIEQEAKDLLHFAPSGLVLVECVYGGYNVNQDLKRFASRTPVDILVATPGRLEDLLSRNELALKTRLGKLQVLIMDEADQLLELGFRPAIERIVRALPPAANRQTLLFTATVPKVMLSVVSLALKRDYATVDCVGDEEEQTHSSVDQHYTVCPFKDQFTALENLLNEHVKRLPSSFKVICFLPTARQAQFYADIADAAKSVKGAKVLAIHSRKSQSQRTRVSDEFKVGTKMILFSSDVSARGMDYPDVTLVVQIGMVEREQYIHRVGRTARAGARGEACLIIDPCENFLIKSQLGDVPMKPLPFDIVPKDGYVSPGVQKALAMVGDVNSELHVSAEQTYQAFLGFYNSHLRKLNWTKEELVQRANEYAFVMGLKEIPFLMKKTVGMMSLKGVPGLRIK